ncbi:NAD(P)H-dependent flavin oxidoreductase [Paenibacillus woosongensis]|uniref:Probable nitronate monooxygenase n=1 Tax=Paenibacillus woosongensis TaxID=307580 RepID=A0ABQ4ML92_9BACL|nr:nitronate monooxygenase [Paenibacillus woosongensis]GIP56763.1 2-nitropropane dioxygenase [Paenibacillus woosongensis]
MYETEFLSIFQLKIPLIQAGMGGVSGVELASSVSNMGCMGVLAQYKNSPDEIVRTIHETRCRTSNFFGVNFIPEVTGANLFDQQIEALIQCRDDRIAVVLYGLPPKKNAQMLVAASVPFIIQVGTKEEAEIAFSLGATCIVLQGNQAGGHLLGTKRTEALLQEVLDCKFDIPLIVSGGIARGSDYLFYRSIGASGCMCGTIFVSTEESNAHPKYKKLIVDSKAKDTVITDLFHIGWAGRSHRVIRNETVNGGRYQSINFIAESKIGQKKYPVPRFSSAVPLKETNGAIELMALYCGESCENVNGIETAGSVIEKFYAELISLQG